MYVQLQEQEEKTFFYDPFGKESCDEILLNSWKRFDGLLYNPLRTVKILMLCKHNIMADTRVTSYHVNQSDIVNIDNEKYKLSVNEKRQIMSKYTSGLNLFDKDLNKNVEVERHFL